MLFRQIKIHKFFFHTITVELKVVCRAEYIEVTVESKNYPGLDTNVTHLEDEACGAFYRDDSKAVFRFGLEECKTKQEDDGKAIHYKNRIIAVVEDVEEEEHITRKSTRILPFQCSYEKKAVISKVFYSPSYVQMITETGAYKLVILGEKVGHLTITDSTSAVGYEMVDIQLISNELS